MDSVYDFFFRSSVKYWQKPTLNYTVYWVLAVFLGFTGLDYLYLGSPLMFVAKALLNFATLGFLWFYDALNATFNQDQVKLAGPFIPGFGPLGIGGGRFVDEGRPGPTSPEEAAKANNFILYGLGLMTLGIFGVDSFMSGDTLSGFLRIGSLLTFIFAPVAIIWYIFNIYRYFIRTGMCLDANWSYFGAPKPAKGAECPNVLQTFTVWVLQTGRTIVSFIPGLNLMLPLIDNFIAALEVAYNMTEKAVEVAVETGKEFVAAKNEFDNLKATMQTKLPVTTDQAQAALEKAKDAAAAAAAPAVAVAAAAPAAAAAAAAAAAPAAATAPSQIGGGSLPPLSVDSSVLGLLAAGVVLTIIVSSVTLTFWRAYQNVRRQESSPSPPARQRDGEENDDGPPDPAAFGGDAE